MSDCRELTCPQHGPANRAALERARESAINEVQAQLPGLMYERTRLLKEFIEPTAVLIPARLQASLSGFRGVSTVLGLPIEWSPSGRWALVIDLKVATCCDLHSRNCEPPSELCCRRCTEAMHPQHRDGSVCSNPDLSGFGT